MNSERETRPDAEIGKSRHDASGDGTPRRATIADAALIAQQRRLMFTENNLIFQGDWKDFEQAFIAWIEPRLLDQSYVGWLAEDGGKAVAGAGVWFMDWPPHYRHVEATRGYLLNFYTSPEARGRGLAGRFVALAIEECRRRGVSVAALHATKMGEPVYAQNGFSPGNEMTRSVMPQPIPNSNTCEC